MVAVRYVPFFLACDPSCIRQPSVAFTFDLPIPLQQPPLVCAFENTHSPVALASVLPRYTSPNVAGPRQPPCMRPSVLLPNSTSPSLFLAGASFSTQQQKRRRRTRGPPRRHSLPVQNPRGCPKRPRNLTGTYPADTRENPIKPLDLNQNPI